jgi:hypothetical protein
MGKRHRPVQTQLRRRWKRSRIPHFIVPATGKLLFASRENIMAYRKKIDMIEQVLFRKLTWLVASLPSMHCVLSKPLAGTGG